MKIKSILVFIILAGLLAGAGFLLNTRYHLFKGHSLVVKTNVTKDIYYCPMHPNFTLDKPGECGICGMKLVKKETNHVKHAGTARQERKILYYRNPMNPQVTSPVAMKDQMGMDYLPVYEKETGVEAGGIQISPERQQFVGIKTEIAQKRQLVYQINTVGKVAYDPELYVAQEEYLQALKNVQATQKSVLASVSQQSGSLLSAAEKKLLLLGMNKEQIQELAKDGLAQENLYLPSKESTAWIYITVYEYEIGLVKVGMPVEAAAIAFPGEVFKGKVLAITPVLDAMTRSVQARAEVGDPEHKLKPEMFVNVKINVDLGEKLSVSEEAVINTGEKTIVVVTDGQGNFYSKDIKIGQKAQGFYEVLDGLSDGEKVVTSGNFLIDSESRLQSAISGEHKPAGDGLASDSQSHKHGQ